MELWDDGTGRITVQKGKNQVEPATVAVTAATARALREILPKDTDPAAPVFGLTGEAPGQPGPCRGAGCGPGRRVHRAQRPHRDGPEDGGGGGHPNAAVQRQGPVEERQHGGPLHQGRVSRGGPQVADLTKMPLPKTARRRPHD